MPNVTPNLGLKKPFGNENVTRANYNENLEILDQSAAPASVLAAHLADYSKHTTQVEKNTWNAKETPAGAQEKVDTLAVMISMGGMV